MSLDMTPALFGMLRRALLPTVLLPLALTACGSGGDTAESVENIIGGALDTADPAVVELIKGSSAGQSSCTASLIAPTLILTAAHCVAPEAGETNIRFGVSTANDIRTATSLLEVKETHFDTLFSYADPAAGHDVAVVILKEPLTGVTPLAINRTPLSAATTGSRIKLVGYGVSDGAARTGAGVKRVVETQVGGVDDEHIMISTRAQNVCFGDSGGPAIQKLGPDSAETVVGIASYVNTNACTGSGFHLRVDKYIAFIDPYLTAAQAQPPPEPDPKPTQPPVVPMPTDPMPANPTPRNPDPTDQDPGPDSRPGPMPPADQGDRDGDSEAVARTGFQGSAVHGSCTCLVAKGGDGPASTLMLLGFGAVFLRKRRARS